MKFQETMSVYKNRQEHAKLISTVTVTKLSCKTGAVETLGISSMNPKLKLWSSHSTGVTAVNFLYHQQLSDMFTMNRPR